MSNEKKIPYLQYDPFDYNPHEIDRSSFPVFNYGSSSIYNIPQTPVAEPQTQNLHGFESDPSYLMSFADCLNGSMDYTTLSKAFDISCSSSEVISSPLLDQGDHLINKAAAAGVGYQNPSTPNSSISTSSNEAGTARHEHENDQDSDKISKKDKQPQVVQSEEAPGDHEDKSKQVNKAKKKEKKQREPRFAFLTKSEIDHLEDGYRWRKYGQKAVKNSPYPRSYYRCTTQKCNVKKRVERSLQDPAIVITTYEGQHNHQCPATLRGSINAVGMLTPSFLASAASGGFGNSNNGSSTFPHELIAQLLTPVNNNQFQLQAHHHDPASSMLYSNLMSTLHQNQQQHQLHVPHDYTWLQDLAPSFSQKKDP
ncbi:WRKY transcription factor 71-like [Argentina anserina]|uniref:WRKY transcription factor 71-like n=1 Tax=Argentina anserina TaxID=57926 RepID=UPI0021767D57|nr:WRKY transcription factor 71-like [Potentilla anserina]